MSRLAFEMAQRLAVMCTLRNPTSRGILAASFA